MILKSGKKVVDARMTPFARRDALFVYEATEDAEWSPTNSRWEVKAKRIKLDGTLSDVEQNKTAYGVAADDIPIKSGNRCIETITAEGKRSLVLLGDVETQLYRVRYADGKIQIYGVGGSDMYKINGIKIEHETEASTGDEYDWWDWITTSSIDKVIYVVPVEPGGDYYAYTGPYSDGSEKVTYQFVDTLPDLDDWRRRVAVPIAYIKITAGAVESLMQLHTGQISYQWLDGDTEVLRLLAERSAVVQKSIQRIESKDALQIHDFDADTAPDSDVDIFSASGISFLVRDNLSEPGTPQVRYVNGAALLDEISDDVDVDHAAIDNIEWGLSGHFVGENTSEPDPIPYSDPEEYALEWLAGFGVVDGIPNTPVKANGDTIASVLLHSKLKDVADKTVGDDHAGTRTKADEVEDEGHPYIHANGDAERNAMTDEAYLGDKEGVESVSPSLRQLFADALTVTVDWILRLLSGGPWTVTDETAADEGTGALLVDGGVYAAKGVYADRDDAPAAVIGANGDYVGQLGTNDGAEDEDSAGKFTTPTSQVYIGQKSGVIDMAVNVESGAYYHGGTKVLGAQGAAVADATGAGDVVGQLNALLAELRTHGIIAT